MNHTYFICSVGIFPLKKSKFTPKGQFASSIKASICLLQSG
ncbi:hypothetical protein COO91_04859 [Nostoc flagelliforme CCNUN1]|uniref:Uncharacterized protein n=1 Tax=Nostoc flagelliforme CCNUN1 TaxID=2038116 RepID=A0A2K8STT7_9NOSO|nr:hypothetical protein COO91_04859 [Nostoc flagelliforme CCNUN1]